MGKPRAGTPVTEKSLLIVGGPHHSVEPDGWRIDRTGCDVAGILGRPHSECFYSYRAAIFWPDDTAFRLPQSFGAWQEACRRAPHLPELHEKLWDPELNGTGQTTIWLGQASVSSIGDEPRTRVDCAWIRQELRALCIRRLRDELIQGVNHRQGVIAVCPASADGRDFEWISDHIRVGRGSPDSHVSVFIPDSVTTEQSDLLRALPTILRQPVSIAISLTCCGLEGEVHRSSEIEDKTILNWGCLWDSTYARGDESIDPEDHPVTVFFPHADGAGRARSAMFSPMDRLSPPIYGPGSVLVIPETESIDRLIDCLCQVMGAKQREDGLAAAQLDRGLIASEEHIKGQNGLQSAMAENTATLQGLRGELGSIPALAKDVRSMQSALAAIPGVIEARDKTIREEAERAALMAQVVTSSVRAFIERVEKKLSGRPEPSLLSRLDDKELYLFLFAIAYQGEDGRKKAISLRDISWALNLGGEPHAQTAARALKSLEEKYPGIGKLIEAFRAGNKKCGRRGRDGTVRMSTNQLDAAQEMDRVIAPPAEDEPDDSGSGL